MMTRQHVVLLSCGKRKATTPHAARNLYQGDLFKKSFLYAESLRPTAIRILSAKHHVINPEQTIEPYDFTLNNIPISQVREWADEVLAQLSEEFLLEEDRFTILAGAKYRRHLEPHFRHCEVPMRGLGIGKQLQFLKARLH